MAIRNLIGSILLISIIVGFLGFFHVVTQPFCLIPKEHFTFSMTFISVDDVVSRFNQRTIGERVRGNALLDHLVSELQAMNYISAQKPEPLSDEQLGF